MVTNNAMTHLQRIGRDGLRFGRAPFIAFLWASLALATASCTPPDPKALLRVSDIETYWVLDPSRTEKRLLAPAIRFKVENLSKDTLLAVDATAAFYREGVQDPWGSGFSRLTVGRKDLAPGARVTVTMSSDARYTLEGEPLSAFSHPTFKSVRVKFFLKVGTSLWVEFGEAAIENVIGSKDARELINHPG